MHYNLHVTISVHLYFSRKCIIVKAHGSDAIIQITYPHTDNARWN